jgi:hypothetical protein
MESSRSNAEIHRSRVIKVTVELRKPGLGSGAWEKVLTTQTLVSELTSF